MRVIVVTGTDTGIGKTVTAAAIVRLGLDDGLRTVMVKPVQTGTDSADPTDAEVVRRLSGCDRVYELIRLGDALAPDMAARRAGVDIPTVDELAHVIVGLARGADLVVVEGAGGILVRLDLAGGTLLGLASCLSRLGHPCEFVVVTNLRLGTLNHTELTVAAIRRAGHTVTGLVIGSAQPERDLAEGCNLAELSRITETALLGVIPSGVGAGNDAWFRDRCAHWLPGVSRELGSAHRTANSGQP